MDLAELWARIKVDASGLTHGLAGAKSQLTDFGSKMSGISTKATFAFAALTGGVALAVREFAKDEASSMRLGTALDLLGGRAHNMRGELERLASTMQRQTVYSDDAVRSAMAYGVNVGITAEKIPEATRAAIGLSNALGIDLQSAMKLTALAMQGDFTMISRYIPAIRTAGSETEKMAKFLEFVKRGFAGAEADAQTFTGKMTRLYNQVGELAERIGAAFVPAIGSISKAINAMLPSMEKFVAAHSELVGGAGITAVAGLALAGPVSKGLSAVTTLAMTFPSATKILLTGALSFGVGVAISKATGFDKWLGDKWADQWNAADPTGNLAKGRAAEAAVQRMRSERMASAGGLMQFRGAGLGLGISDMADSILVARDAALEQAKALKWAEVASLGSAKAIMSGRDAMLEYAKGLLVAETEEKDSIARATQWGAAVWEGEMRSAIAEQGGVVSSAGGRVTSAQDALRAAEEAAGRRPSFAGLEDFSKRIQLALAVGPQDEAVAVAKQQLEVEEKALALQEKELAALENAGKVLVD